MSKRNFECAFKEEQANVSKDGGRLSVHKHTLDSDEEDDEYDDNVLDADDIEGEEDGMDRQEGQQKFTAFNLKEEMEEGHFDKEGHFHWKNEKEVRDNWLDNIDWQRIKHSSNSKDKYKLGEQGLGAESDSESETGDQFNEMSSYKNMLQYMRPKETVNKALKRLGGADMKLSSLERLKRKKAGTLHENKDVIKLTEHANEILTKLGNMDVYQETYEHIEAKIIDSEKNKALSEPELDMYADDFDEKEKMVKFGGDKNNTLELEANDGSTTKNETMWEFKWKIEDTEIHGPNTTAQMVKWSKENYFGGGVMVRKCGENSNFYTSNRIDFELYE